MAQGIYQGYMAAVLQSLDVSETQQGFGIRPPHNTTLGQVCQIVGNWLDRHPEAWTYSAYSLCMTALHEVWPRSTAANYFQ